MSLNLRHPDQGIWSHRKHPAGLFRTDLLKVVTGPAPQSVQNTHLPRFPWLPTWIYVGLFLWQFCSSSHLMVNPAFLISFPIAAFYNHASAPGSHSEGQCFPGLTPVEDQSSPLCLYSVSQCHVSEEDGSFLIQLLFLLSTFFFLTPSLLFIPLFDVYWMIVMCQIL